ncbi:hypothetical protein NBE98_09675 [Clostridium swellfunianum]|uniref:hypothetical protein n=1 Tax=Clostridium swellfunianum TaxID=1367462 RepID=UPI00202E46A5|nr:hypothetical protein [Clostridium swellfunianum]MCM0648642.1 hypothetical protein [Clostridium swellfunianum]
MKGTIFCTLLKREISEGYCFELCNIASDDILIEEDKGKITDWNKAQKICKECARYEE